MNRYFIRNNYYQGQNNQIKANAQASNLTLQNIRSDIMEELEAINNYQDHIDMSTNAIEKSTLEHIIIEEMIHVGELLTLLHTLNPIEKEYFDKGAEEFNNRIK